MIFSPPTQHALRALIYLARQDGRAPMHARTIASAEAIPSAFLAKILNRLRARGFLHSVMGPGGGYVLARPASEIRVHDIVEAFDDAHPLQKSCLLGLPECNDDNACALHERWKSIRSDLSQWIGALTLDTVATQIGTAPTTPSRRSRPRRGTVETHARRRRGRRA